MSDVYRKISLSIIKGGLFIVPFIPLYVSRALFFPYITGKAFIFRTIIEIIFAAWLFLVVFYKEYRPRKTFLLSAIGIFVVIATLATIFGVNPARSFWSNFERMEGLVTYLHLFAYFLVLGHVFQKKDWLVFFNLFVASGFLENFYALRQKLGYIPSPQGGFRVDGTIGNPTYLAAYLIFILAFCLILFINSKNKYLKGWYGFAGLFSLLTIYFTATRGVIMALLAGGLVAGILYLVLIKPKTPKEIIYRKAVIGLITILILTPAALWFFRGTAVVKKSEILSRFASTFTEFSGKARREQARFFIWNMSLQGVKERPILGWGPDNYGVVFAKYYRPELYSKEPWFDRSHNIVFDWLINAGVPGLLSYFGVLISAAYLIWNNYFKKKITAEMTILLSALLLVYLLQNFFVFDQLATYISYFAVLAFIQNAAISENTHLPQEKLKKTVLQGRPLAVGLLLALLVPIVYFINAKPLFANLNLLNALGAQSQDMGKSFVYFEKALSYDTLGNQEIREQLTRFAIGVGAIQEASPEFKHEVLKKAIMETQKGAQENLLDPRAYLFLGTIYGKVGLFDQAIAVLNKALELSPAKQQIYFELADVYISKEDYGKAVELAERAYELEPRYDEAMINLAATYILNNEQKKADELLLSKAGAVDVADNILVQVYSRTKNYKRLLGVWQAFVKSDPTNLNYVKSLVGAHLLLGQNKEAVKVLEETIKLRPDFQEEGETYIKEISVGK